MTTDYAGNSKKQNEGKEKKQKEELEPVITEPVIVKRRSFGRRIKDTFIEMDLKSVSRYVVMGVIIPGAKNIIFDAGAEALRKALYRDSGSPSALRRGTGLTRIDYRTPTSRPYSARPGYSALEPGSRSSRMNKDDIFLSSREDADLVLERMQDVLDQVDVVTIRDLYELLNRETDFTHEGYGWISLVGSRITETRDGYLLDLPPAQVLR